MTTHPRFNIAGELPVGATTLIEASAGTGKTYALSALTVRMVAEHGIPISQILVVTFTRAATAELRDRIRSRLIDAQLFLGDPGDSNDPLLQVLGECSVAERQQRLHYVSKAVQEFDTATVSTIHGFCSVVLGSLGVLSDRNVDAVPAESDDELVRQVCSDLVFTRAFDPSWEPVDEARLIKLVRAARNTPDAEIRAESGTQPHVQLAQLVDTARKLVDDRLSASGGVSFDTILTAVRNIVADDAGVVAQLRRQYRVALIDEFQDTDPVQWEIFNTVFGSGSGTTLVLVGDPKQAIYAFRGGDVHTYLSAQRHANMTALSTNQRSDAPVIAAMNVLGAHQYFGDSSISYQQVEASDRHAGRQLILGDGSAAPGMAIRCLVDPAHLNAKKLTADPARRRIAADLADEARKLLSSATIDDGNGSTRPVTPGDIAVLISGKAEADDLVNALRQRRIPAVVRAGDNVADSEAAEQWYTLLWALDRPSNVPRATAAALTWFFGWTAEQVVESLDELNEAANERLAALQQQLVEWADLLLTSGMPALFSEAMRSHDLVPRLLKSPLGERQLTDLEHLAEMVHAGAHGGGRGLSAATALMLLDDLSGSASDELAAEASQRRIESDADAVQILTIHGSKGLEFPIVMLPSLWSGGNRVKAPQPLSYYDKTTDCRVLEVSSKASEVELGGGMAQEQNCGDQQRLTYVALTRAAHLSVVWWSPLTASGAAKTGLARLLFGDQGKAPGESVDLPPARTTVRSLEDSLAERGGGEVITVSEVGAEPVVPLAYEPQQSGTPQPELVLGSLGRPLHRVAYRWSFTQISGAIRHSDSVDVAAGVDVTDPHGSDSGANDEGSAPLALTTEFETPIGTQWSGRPLLEGLGGGAPFGNLIHGMFEDLDFASPNLESQISDWLRATQKFGVTELQRERLPQELCEVIRTPFGPHFAELSLADLTAASRLNELNFYFPLSPNSPVNAGRIGALVADHLTTDDPLWPWATSLALGLRHVDLQGFLTGSIDLTLRFTKDGIERYSVVDYKSNRLTPAGSDPALSDYHPDKLPHAMAHSNYVLQSLVYAVALHRYLRWRLADYSPAIHLGPVGYLFVRGMVGANAPRSESSATLNVPSGVFSWELPTGLVEALSDLLAGPSDGGASK